MSKVIAVCNQKGGVGKTTTAVNLAASFAALEKKTLLIDMDPQGNASQGLGFMESQETDIHEILDMADNPDNMTFENLKPAIADTTLDYLKVITSGPDLAVMEIELVNAMSREHRLERIIKVLKDEFEFIIIDAPPSLNLLTLNVLTAATSVLIPVQCEYYALQGMTELFKTIREVQKNLNANLKIEGALLTMFANNNLSKQVAEEVRENLADTVFQTVIPRNVRLSEAPSHGKPVILYDVQSSGSQSYMKLAEEILNKDR
ncbi:MAG: ParA family protein [Fibrobacter sp.]|jgi:chromosome partitioning protein|uniref:ParA family protein n=1 Tax=Fibrobacter sp. UWR2 TaxID=1964352 RepID=UPI000B5231E7|nr:ParA family protein [Fibrobacter sp. UWR2]MBO4830265.1 ParA family protein [Fibrobacter sp.]MBO7414843.1 ParA family protein [Fibrobacter sp.]MBR2210553.1 ParA family protein [Fibrobacter sp.]OWU99313.1 chromosome partitioning protein ParA [Fibrobacter sp. UWR2]